MKMNRRDPLDIRRRLVLAFPYLWLVLFFLGPFVLIAKVSLSQSILAQPPYLPVFGGWTEFSDLRGFWDKFRAFSLQAYFGLVRDPLYVQSYLGSVAMAGAATMATLCIAYPFALVIARAESRRRPLLIMLAVAPFWTSFLIRVYAWILILKDEGLLNSVLVGTGLIHEPLQIFATNWAVLIGLVYSYLPFMILPLYASLEKQDPSLAEAAADLGAGPFEVFRRVTLPLSLPGVLAGSLLVFIPAIGEFVIPDLLGGSNTLMIGSTLWNDFFSNRDWPAASAAAIVLLVLLIGPLGFFERLRQGNSRSKEPGI
jgi:putrescine transport system permease protein